MNVNLGDRIRKKVAPDGSIELVAGDNEIWFNNANQPVAPAVCELPAD